MSLHDGKIVGCLALHVCNSIMIAGYVEIANKQGVFGKRVLKSQQQRPNRKDNYSMNTNTTKSDVAMLNHYYSKSNSDRPNHAINCLEERKGLFKSVWSIVHWEFAFGLQVIEAFQET